MPDLWFMEAILFLEEYSGMKGFSNIVHEKKIYQSCLGKTNDVKSPPSMKVQNLISNVNGQIFSPTLESPSWLLQCDCFFFGKRDFAIMHVIRSLPSDACMYTFMLEQGYTFPFHWMISNGYSFCIKAHKREIIQ